MSTAFTTIIDGLDWQGTDFINELRLAHSERSQARGGASVSNVSAGHDIQAASFWNTMQNWIDNNLDGFIDHISGPVNAEGEAFLYWTVAAFRSAANMHADGWRRATTYPTDWTDLNDSAYSYGVMQAEDIVGPWIFDDLQKAFSTLRWTASSCTWTGKGELNGGQAVAFFYTGKTVEEAKAEVIGTYNIAKSHGSWEGYPPMAWGKYYIETASGISGDLILARRYQYAQISGLYTGIPHTAIIYLLGQCPAADEENFDSYSIPELVEGTFIDIQAESESSSAEHEILFGNTSSPPPGFPVEPTWPNQDRKKGYEIGNSGWLLQWNFTNQG